MFAADVRVKQEVFEEEERSAFFARPTDGTMPVQPKKQIRVMVVRRNAPEKSLSTGGGGGAQVKAEPIVDASCLLAAEVVGTAGHLRQAPATANHVDVASLEKSYLEVTDLFSGLVDTQPDEHVQTTADALRRSLEFVRSLIDTTKQLRCREAAIANAAHRRLQQAAAQMRSLLTANRRLRIDNAQLRAEQHHEMHAYSTAAEDGSSECRRSSLLRQFEAILNPCQLDEVPHPAGVGGGHNSRPNALERRRQFVASPMVGLKVRSFHGSGRATPGSWTDAEMAALVGAVLANDVATRHDCGSFAAKRAAWETIAVSVNAVTPRGGVSRSWQDCRTRYAYWRRTRREEVAALTDVFSCTECKRSFDTLLGMQQHRRFSHYVHEYPREGGTCARCGKVLTSGLALMSHLETAHRPKEPPKRSLCDQCGKSFSSKYNMVQHVSQVHAEASAQVACEICGFLCKCESYLKEHMKRAHCDPTYKCAQCDRVYRTANARSTHVQRAHLKLRPYKCDLCAKAFATTNSRRDHRTTHTGERPHACPLCPSSFAVRNTLRVHLVSCGRNDGYSREQMGVTATTVSSEFLNSLLADGVPTAPKRAVDALAGAQLSSNEGPPKKRTRRRE